MNGRLVAIVAVLIATALPARGAPALRYKDRVRLAEAFRIGETLGDRVWKHWTAAPFAVLLVTRDHEFLIRHPQPSPDFTLVGRDPLLKCDVYARPRIHEVGLLATFPAIQGSPIPTIVIGQAENTEKKTSAPWVVTVLHEHFHQLQYSQPTYYAEVEKLDLARGDTSGMWMLNYAFPYEQPDVKRQFEALCRRLAELMVVEDNAELAAKLPAYLEERHKLEPTLGPENFRYLSFQIWQEGIARYTEYRMASLAAKHHEPSKEFRELSDFEPFGAVAEDLRSKIVEQLQTLELDRYRRVAFYPFGAAEALILDRIEPRWKRKYLKEKFYVDRYFERLVEIKPTTLRDDSGGALLRQLLEPGRVLAVTPLVDADGIAVGIAHQDVAARHPRRPLDLGRRLARRHELLAEHWKVRRVEHEHDALQPGLYRDPFLGVQEHDGAAVRGRHPRPAERASALALDIDQLEAEQPVEADRALDHGDVEHGRAPTGRRIHDVGMIILAAP